MCPHYLSCRFLALKLDIYLSGNLLAVKLKTDQILAYKVWLPARCFIKQGRWIKCLPPKVKGRVWKWFLFGTNSKPVLPLIKYPQTGLSRSSRPDGANTHQIFSRLFSCEMHMVQMTTSNWSMWDAFMTSSTAVNKCFFNSSLGPVAVTASATEVVTCQPTSDLVTQDSDVHRPSPTDFLCPIINAEIFSGAATKSRPVS